uniref:Uncharacterized protein n=1 Tax=Siphoviridae sp. cthSp75 TaxID=2826424 RepID=A0A8S5NEP9_9CAUD|nr:MAG TPA: hypothetical protein [Siphoviridae sp. cthSp75]
MLCRYCVSLGTYCFTPTPIPYPLFCREFIRIET